MENSVGFKMLAKMGWNKDKGLGKMGNGIIDPVEACGQNIYGSKVVEKDWHLLLSTECNFPPATMRLALNSPSLF